MAEPKSSGAEAAEEKVLLTPDEIQEMREREKEQAEEERRYKMQQPRMRLPRVIKKGAIIPVRVKIRHPSRTGLRMLPDGTFERSRPAFYVKLVEVFYGDELVSKFEMNSSTSDDPLLGFNVRADREAPIRVVFTNHRGERSEVSKHVQFS